MPFLFFIEALGGVGLFILGMKTMSGGLQRLAGVPLHRALDRITGNRLSAPLLGGTLSFILQSGGAASILVIGFVNAGLVSLYQALAVLLGTGLGTAVALQLYAFRIPFFALPAILAGVILKFYGKKRRTVYLGEIILGIGLLFFGLETMESRFSPLSSQAVFGKHHALLGTPLYAVFSGALLTFMVQSGRTAIAIVLTLAANGILSFETGVAMIAGEVVGTSCITAIGAIGGNLAAKRTVLVYFVISLLAAGLFLTVSPWLTRLFPHLPGGEKGTLVTDLVNLHSLFVLLILTLFLPLTGFFARKSPVMLRGRDAGTVAELRPKFLDTRILDTPVIAISQARQELIRMAEVTESLYRDTVAQFHKFNAKRIEQIREKENLLDILHRDISNFLVNLARRPQSLEISAQIPPMLQFVNGFERIGDEAEAIFDYLRRKKESRILFSDAAMEELRKLSEQIGELLSLAVASTLSHDGNPAEGAEQLHDEIRILLDVMRKNHLERLKSGNCSVAAGLVYDDILTAYGKIDDCALAIIKASEEAY